jgi:hypothetical protein
MIYARYDSANYVDSVRVTVVPRTTLFNDPFLTFFSTEETVKRNEKGHFMEWYGDKDGKEYEIEFSYVQKTELQHYSMHYHFNTGGYYDYSYIGFSTSFADNVFSHLSDQYLLQNWHNQDSENGWCTEWHFINPDSTLFIRFLQREKSLTIYYQPFTI